MRALRLRVLSAKAVRAENLNNRYDCLGARAAWSVQLRGRYVWLREPLICASAMRAYGTTNLRVRLNASASL